MTPSTRCREAVKCTHSKIPILLLLCLPTFPGHPTLLEAQPVPAGFKAMQARAIGPAGMSGRVSAVDVNLSDRNIIFVGAATGGVWRSQDGGIQWEPVFDDQPVLGIGSVAIAQANPRHTSKPPSVTTNDGTPT